MRKRFELQYSIGQKRIEDTVIDLKCRDAFPKLLLALKELFINSEYNEQVFRVLEDKIQKGKAKTGRTGMELWQIFVLAQARLCLNASYDRLHDLANNHSTFRQIMGIETDYSFKKVIN
jgi:IS5 family transposase